MTKTIALYISSISKGGAERVIVNLAEYFYSRGYKVLLVTTRKEKEEYQISEGIIRQIWPKGFFILRPEWYCRQEGVILFSQRRSEKRL